MKTNHHISDKDWESIAKTLYDEQANEGKEASAAGHPDQDEFENIVRTARKVDQYFELSRFDQEDAWEKVARSIAGPTQERKSAKTLIMNRLAQIAASVLFAALLAYSGYLIYQNSSAPTARIEINSEKEEVKTIILPDGSVVALNSETKLVYPREFSGDIREVTIEGEAFFDVKPNPEKPFVIHASDAQIKVLGTSFNVNAYPSAREVQVIVETGRVRVSNQKAPVSDHHELILTPGDKGTFDNLSGSLQKSTNRDPNFLAWKTRNFSFEATPLSEVVDQLTKVYKVDIRLADKNLSGLPLTARFNNYSLDFILKVIESTFDIEVQRVDGQYILKARS